MATWPAWTLLGLAIAGTASATGRGDPDPTFGTNGVATATIGVGPYSQALFLDPDGKIVVSGTAEFPPDGRRVFLARFGADGTLDATYGTGGVAVTSVESQGFGCTRAIRQSDGRVLVACVRTPQQPEIVRLEPDGSIDATFANAGVLTPTATIEYVVGLALRPDGRILLAGTRGFASTGHVVLLQYGTDGTPDPTFGSGGAVDDTLPVYFSILYDTELGLDGRIVIVGDGHGTGALVIRYDPDGTRDATFGTAGVVTDDYGRIVGAAVQPDGKIVGAGSLFSGRFKLVRYDSNGALDASFGLGGTALPTFGIGQASGSDVLREPDGGLIGHGAAYLGLSANFVDAFVHYLPDGTYDPRFAAGGRLLTGTRANGMTRQADGKLLTVGAVSNDLVLARYEMACPSSPDVDADGTGDSCDLCVGPTVARAALQIGNAGLPTEDETLRFSGRFGPVNFAGIDPVANGVLLLVEDSTGSVVQSVLLPGGARDEATGIGWISKLGKRFRYTNPGGNDPSKLLRSRVWVAGVTRCTLNFFTGGEVRFRVSGKSAVFPLAPTRLPLRATLVLTPPRSATGACGTTDFGPSGCTFDGKKVRCR